MKKDKKILILCNSSTGLYRFRKELIKKLIENGNKVIVSTPKNSYIEELENLGCEIVETKIDRRGINPLKDLKLLSFYKKLIKKINTEKIITYTIKPNIYGGIAARKNKVDYYANITGLGTAFQNKNLIHKVVSTLYKFALKKANTVFFENEGNKNVFVKEKITDERKFVVLNGAGVNLDLFPYKPLKESDLISFLFIGRIMKEKGVNELFETATKIKEEFQNIEFNFIGGFEENYKEKIEDLEKNDIIKYHGMQSDVQSFIEKSHCVILPSYHEGMSNALLESASMGRPLIASNINGCKEAIIENKSGFLCETKNVDSLYKAIKKYIELPFEEKQKMGKLSRKHMEENFDKRKVVEKTILAMFGEGK